MRLWWEFLGELGTGDELGKVGELSGKTQVQDVDPFLPWPTAAKLRVRAASPLGLKHTF